MFTPIKFDLTIVAAVNIVFREKGICQFSQSSFSLEIKEGLSAVRGTEKAVRMKTFDCGGGISIHDVQKFY